MNAKLKEAYESVYSGWWPILGQYVPQILELDPDVDLYVKEKWGLLRMGVVGLPNNEDATAEIHALCAAAEEKSATICEICGDVGILRPKLRWHQTLCHRCYAMSPNERGKFGMELSEKRMAELEDAEAAYAEYEKDGKQSRPIAELWKELDL